MTANVPVLAFDDILVASIGEDLQDTAALNLQHDIASAVTRTGARGVIIDISSVQMLDSFLARVLAEIAACCRLLAAETVVVGMRPAIAITLVELGLTLRGLRTAVTVADAEALLRGRR